MFSSEILKLDATAARHSIRSAPNRENLAKVAVMASTRKVLASSSTTSLRSIHRCSLWCFPSNALVHQGCQGFRRGDVKQSSLEAKSRRPLHGAVKRREW